MRPKRTTDKSATMKSRSYPPIVGSLLADREGEQDEPDGEDDEKYADDDAGQATGALAHRAEQLDLGRVVRVVANGDGRPLHERCAGRRRPDRGHDLTHLGPVLHDRL